MAPERVTLEYLEAAWEKMKQPVPERPLVVSPHDYELLERRGIIKNGVIDVAELRRQAVL